MRSIVSFCGFPTYQLPKYLTTVLKPLTNETRHKLQSTENFTDAIKTVQVPDDHKLVSFDVKTLFIGIPLQLVLDCTETATNRSIIGGRSFLICLILSFLDRKPLSFSPKDRNRLYGKKRMAITIF